MLSEAMGDTKTGKMEPKIAQALAALAGALVRVVGAGEMEERVRELERQMRRGSQQWPA